MNRLKIVKNIYCLLSVCMIAAGVLLMIYPAMSLYIICHILGVTLILMGIIKIIGYFTGDIFQLAFQFDFALGVVSIILGIALMTRTEHMIEVLSVLTGIFILSDAVLKIQTSFDARRFGIEKWWLILTVAVITAIFGGVLLVLPIQAGEAVTMIIGANLFVDGILNISVVVSTVHTIRKQL